MPHCLDQYSFLEDELAILLSLRRHIGAQVLLDIRMHVVVDPDYLILCHICQILYR